MTTARYTPSPGSCDLCGELTAERHLRAYAGGGEDRVAVCCDCNDCDADCERREEQLTVTEGQAS